MAVKNYVTKAQINEIILRTAPSGTTAAEIVLAPKKGTIDDLTDVTYFDPELNSRFRIRFESTLTAAASFLTDFQAALAAKKDIMIGLRIGVAEGTSTKRSLGIYLQPPATASTTVAFPVQPMVNLLDANGDPYPLAGVVITATQSAGTDTLGGTLTATTDAHGVAKFASLKFTLAGGTHVNTLTFTATGFTSSAASSTITVS